MHPRGKVFPAFDPSLIIKERWSAGENTLECWEQTLALDYGNWLHLAISPTCTPLTSVNVHYPRLSPASTLLPPPPWLWQTYAPPDPATPASATQDASNLSVPDRLAAFRLPSVLLREHFSNLRSETGLHSLFAAIKAFLSFPLPFFSVLLARVATTSVWSSRCSRAKADTTNWKEATVIWQQQKRKRGNRGLRRGGRLGFEGAARVTREGVPLFLNRRSFLAAAGSFLSETQRTVLLWQKRYREVAVKKKHSCGLRAVELEYKPSSGRLWGLEESLTCAGDALCENDESLTHCTWWRECRRQY